MRRIMVWAIVLLVPAAFACAGCAAQQATVRVGDATLVVHVADDPAARSQGLQGWDALGPDEGMLFSWDDAASRTFTMKTVGFPIEVVFIDEMDRVSAIHSLAVGSEDVVTSPSPSRWVIEVPAGWTASHDVEVGSPFVAPDPD